MSDERRARIYLDSINYWGNDRDAQANLQALLAEVRAEEREGCAQCCENWADLNREAFREQSLAAESCAGAIRRRSPQEKDSTTQPQPKPRQKNREGKSK